MKKVNLLIVALLFVGLIFVGYVNKTPSNEKVEVKKPIAENADKKNMTEKGTCTDCQKKVQRRIEEGRYKGNWK